MSNEEKNVNLPEEEFDEELDNIVVMTDDEGNEVEFEFLDLIEYEGNDYVVLLPTEPSGEEEDEVTILKVDDTGDDEYENYVGVDTEEELVAVFNIFKERFKDVFDFADDAE